MLTAALWKYPFPEASILPAGPTVSVVPMVAQRRYCWLAWSWAGVRAAPEDRVRLGGCVQFPPSITAAPVMVKFVNVAPATVGKLIGKITLPV